MLVSAAMAGVVVVLVEPVEPVPGVVLKAPETLISELFELLRFHKEDVRLLLDALLLPNAVL